MPEVVFCIRYSAALLLPFGSIDTLISVLDCVNKLTTAGKFGSAKIVLGGEPAVSSPSPFLAWATNVYGPAGVRPTEVHAPLFCCQPELVPLVVLAMRSPERPSVRFGGVELDATSMDVFVTAPTVTPGGVSCCV